LRQLSLAQFIGEELNMTKETEERIKENEKRRLNKILNMLEQRISKLEKVLASHAKCIGELREDKNENNN
jgi:hypothetical protein